MSKLISLKEQETYIRLKGWSTWYNEKYWVHPKTVENLGIQDYTNYGMDLNSAYCFEKLNLPPFELAPFGFGFYQSQVKQGLENKEKIQGLLKKLEKNNG